MTLIACSCTARKIAYISLYYCKTAAFTIRSLFTLNRKNVIKISISECQSRNWEVIRNKGSSHRNVNVLRLTAVIRTENGVTVALIHMKMISRVSSLKSCCEFPTEGRLSVSRGCSWSLLLLQTRMQPLAFSGF